MNYRHWSLMLLLVTFIVAQPDIMVEPLQFNVNLSHYTEDLVADCTLTITDNGDGSLEFDWTEADHNPTVTFTKPDFADWTDAVYQDRITDSVWIARKDNQSLYNAKTESGYNNPYYNDPISPEGTLWYFEGINSPPTRDYSAPAEFATFVEAHDYDPASIIDVPGVLFLTADSVFLNIVFHSYTGGNGGGGFSYTRDSYMVPWLTVEEVAVRSVNWILNVNIDANNLPKGDYGADIVIMSNDADTPELIVPVYLTVDGPLPSVSVTPVSIDAGLLIQGESDSTSHKLIITNNGDATLYWELDFKDTTPGEEFFIEKANNADWTLPENQDYITDRVILTRASEEGLFNIAVESYYSSDDSPLGTEWSSYPTSESSPEDYGPWRYTAHPYNSDADLGDVTSLHLIEEDLYYDVVFHSWTSGEDEGGGGFTYTRSTPHYNWIGAEYTDGSVPGIEVSRSLVAGQSDTVDVYFMSAGVPGGMYSGEVYVKSNDPVNPEIAIPVQLEVYEPLPNIQVDVTEISSSVSHYTGTLTTSENFTITNNGDADLTVKMFLDGGGIPVTFTKVNYSDWTQEENQDFITENVIITRQNSQGIFNIARESSYDRNYGRNAPYGTLWAHGATKDVTGDDYETWYYATDRLYNNGMGETFSLFLVEDSLYFDVVFTQWTCCGNGGGFSYTRTPAMPSWAWLPVKQDTIPYDIPVRMAETYAIEFDGSELEPGYYHTELVIKSNDPSSRTMVIPVEFFVDGPMPMVDLAPASIDLILQANTVDTTQKITITNNGDADLFWKLRVENPYAESVTFAKEDWADWLDPANQDRITEKVWITRADFEGLFNAARESSYGGDEGLDRGIDPIRYGSPIGTYWAPGLTNEVAPNQYTSWEDAVNENPPASVGKTYSMYLYWENLYFDVTFNSWTIGEYGGGGGFSYTRTQIGTPWLEAEFRDGQVPFGTGNDVALKFNTNNMPGGDYYAEIHVSSTGFDGAAGMIPVHLFVDGPTHAPNILGVMDMPEDQGGWVKVDFQRSFFDTNLPEDVTRAAEAYTIEINDGTGWVGAATQVAYGQEAYSVLVHTTVDSSDKGNGLLQFRVVAAMDEGNWISGEMSGYSIDNIAPPAPAAVFAGAENGNVVLTWDASDCNDLRNYAVYRGINVDFTPAAENMVGTAESNQFVDETISQIGEYYYRVSGVDVHGNEGEHSDVATVFLGVEDGVGIPKEFALHRNYPNPFNPTTTIRYDLPEQALVSIVIYDMLGRRINTLVNRVEPAGYKAVTWNGTNAFGQPVGTGVYLYQITAGNFTQTYKMVLMK